MPARALPAVGEHLGDIDVGEVPRRHVVAAAGALEAALCWLAVSRRDNPDGRLPPMAGTDYDPALAPIRLAGAGARWPEGRRLALSTSFAFGGNNAALIIGEAA